MSRSDVESDIEAKLEALPQEALDWASDAVIEYYGCLRGETQLGPERFRAKAEKECLTRFGPDTWAVVTDCLRAIEGLFGKPASAPSPSSASPR